MKTYIKIFFLPFLIVFIFNGCVRVAYGLVNPFTEETVGLKEIDVEKAGVVADFDIDISEPEYYEFNFNYISITEEYKISQENFKKGIKTESDKIRKDIVGDEYENKKGTKIVLKLTITPLSLDKSENIFSLGSRYTEDKAKNLQVGKAMEYTMDLSEIFANTYKSYCFDSKKSEWKKGDVKKCRYLSAGKLITEIVLSKGKYHIKLENLEDVPEIKKIKTTLLDIYFFRPNLY